MQVPQYCPKCKGVIIGNKEREHDAYWIQRTELDYDSDFEDRIDDQIWECSYCHTLFRLRWKLVSFIKLVEEKQK